MRAENEKLLDGETIEARYVKSIVQQYQVVDGVRRQLHGMVREIEDRVNDELRS